MLTQFKARAMKFVPNKAAYRTFIKFKQYSSSPKNEWEFEDKIYIPYSTNCNVKAKVCSLPLHTMKNQLQISNPRPIFIVNYQFIY